MRKIVLALAAVAALGFTFPLAAPAQAEEGKVVIRTGDRDHDRDHGRRWDRDRDRHEVRHHRDHDRVVIIKKRHRDHD